MNSKQLRYAIELSKHLNFSYVAEKHKISQPALSKHIINLEKELGVTLFDRSKSPITLTAAGEYFINNAEHLLLKEEQLCNSMEQFRSGKSGSLSIGISPFRSLYLIPHLAARINEKYPDVKIRLHEYSSDILRKMALDGAFDFTILNLPADESVFDFVPIEQDKLVLAVPEKKLSLIEGTPGKDLSRIDIASCEKLPFIVPSKSQEMRILFEKICRSAGIQPTITMEVVGLATAWAMTRNGIGATLLPLQFIKSTQSSNSVRLFVPDCEINTRQPAVITRRGQYLSEYAKYAIDILTEKK